MDLDEILYGGDDNEDDPDSILFKAVSLTIPKWRKFKTSELSATYEPIGGFG
jgi:hypothetical protein